MKELKAVLGNSIKSVLLGIIIFGTIIRFHFLNLVKTQAHWWDSLAYGSLAKNLILHLWDESPFIIHETIIRPPMLPLIWSWMLRLGASDYTVILLTNLIPSIIAILIIYLIGKEMYSRKAGLIAALFASVSWIHIFYAVRIMTDIPSMCLVLTSIYFFLKSYDSLSLKPWIISVLCLSFAVLFRYSHATVAFAFTFFLILYHKTKLLKNKNFWLGGVIGAIPIILFIIINLFNYGSFLPAGEEYASSASEKQEFAWYTLGFINHILRMPLVLLFYAGLAFTLFKIVLSHGFIFKNKESRMHLFNIILMAIVFAFFIFGIRAAEDRYLLGISSIFFILPSLMISKIYDYLSKRGKLFALIICLGLIGWTIYANISFGNYILLDKKDSYKPMKYAFEWVKYNTPSNSVIAGEWIEPYAIYYAERKVQALPADADFSNFTLKADYFVVNVVHTPNEKILAYFNKMVESGQLVPIKAFYFDQNQQQLAVVIYKRI